MKTEVEVEGLRTFEDGLFILKPATSKRVVLNAMRWAFKPMFEMAKGLAPESDIDARGKGDERGRYIKLKDSMKVSTRVHKRHKAAKENDVEIYMGPGGGAKSIVNEFGSFKQRPTPFMRPAWDAHHEGLLKRFVERMAQNIKRALAKHEADVKRKTGM